jgi:hypothetical protein
MNGKDRTAEIFFDETRIASDLKGLSFEALQHVLDLVLDDRSRLPFNILLRQVTPTSVAGSPDQILIGLGLSVHAESSSAA